MFDERLRTVKDRAFAVPVATLGAVGPGWWTAFALLGGVCSGVAAGVGWSAAAIAAFVLGRMADGLDGAIARHRGRTTDLGGYLDMLGDTIAVDRGDTNVWMWCAVLLATFYVNSISWTYLAAVAEKRGEGAAQRGSSTTVHMPTGLVEGAETIVLYVLMLAWPGRAMWWFIVMTALVAVTVCQRVVWSVRHLR